MLALFSFSKRRQRKVDEAVAALQDRLRTCSMIDLIDAMDNNELVHPSLKLKREKHKEFASTDQISWYAFEQARKVGSQAHKAELLAMLGHAVDQNRRKHIYYTLGYYCSNAKDHEVYQQITQGILSENDSIAESALIGLRRLDKTGLDITVLKQMAEQGQWELATTAIDALGRAPAAEVEDFLIGILRTTGAMEREAACGALARAGTEKSLPDLQELKKRTRDVLLRSTIEYAIAEIHKRVESAPKASH